MGGIIIKETNKSILETKEMFESIFSTIDEAIHVVNKKGVTIFYNHVAARHDGLIIEDVLHRHIVDSFPSLNKENSTLLTVIETGKPIYNKHQQYMNKNGLQVFTVNTTLPIFVKGELIGAVEIGKDISKIKELSEKLLDLQAQMLEPTSIKTTMLQRVKFHFKDIVTQNDRMEKLIQVAKRISFHDSPILIEGDTGTGKELFVQAIHSYSPRAEQPFIAQNCAAIPSTLLEGILFGTVKGSFTGAENRPGLFELAHNGTLFLDEINSMPIELQAKLLRVLQDGIVRRVGDTVSRQVNVRVIAAINVDSKTAIEKGLIRKDLFYRINVAHFVIPSLRERLDDLPILIIHFIEKYNKRFNKLIKGISSQVNKVFTNYDWPGNVRELEHVIEYAMNIVDEDTIQLNHLPLHMQHSNILSIENNIEIQQSNLEMLDLPWDKDKGLKEVLEAWEKLWIIKSLEMENGNINKAAKRLKIPRQTLQYKISKYVI